MTLNKTAFATRRRVVRESWMVIVVIGGEAADNGEVKGGEATELLTFECFRGQFPDKLREAGFDPSDPQVNWVRELLTEQAYA